jgi:hypothetical protein
MGKPGTRGAAEFLSLAAAPTFAVMALLTAVAGGGPLAALCSAATDASPLTGMIPMYLLMSAFHTAPWLKLISSRTSAAAISSASPRGGRPPAVAQSPLPREGRGRVRGWGLHA